jgi:hypothetical protein
LVDQRAVHLIDIGELTHKLNVGGLIRLGAELRANPKAAPPVTVQRAGNRYRLLRGQQRLMVAQTEEQKEIDAVIEGMPDAD